MNNVIYVDFVNKKRVSANQCWHLSGLLMTIHNCSVLLGQDFVIQQLQTYCDIER